MAGPLDVPMIGGMLAANWAACALRATRIARRPQRGRAYPASFLAL